MSKVAFQRLDGTLHPGLLHHRGLPTYDPATGTVTSPAAEVYPVEVLVSQYRADEIDGVRVLSTDRRLCIRQETLPVTPGLRDRVELDSATWWLLVRQEQDAAGLVWIWQGRAEGEQLP
jgi:hypothetical protein